jgi:signal transduction histidine kinase/ActR/RegA family two-component response regulator
MDSIKLDNEARVLVLMPTARDALRTVEILAEASVRGYPCGDLAQLCRELRVGASAVLLTDDALLGDTCGQLAEAARDQPSWSAVPFVVLARESAGPHLARSVSEALTNIIVVERPVRTRTLNSVILSALRARRHQYEIRDAIEARERQAAELMKQDERLRFALSAGRLGAWELDLVSNEMVCSDICKASFGRSAGEPFTYEDLRASIIEADRSRVFTAISESLASGADYDSEYRIRWPDGSEHWVLMRGRIAYDDVGRPLRMAGVSLDISDRKRTLEALHESQLELARQADQLRAADARKDEFLATLAHELRNPLAPIRTGLELLIASEHAAAADPTLSVMNRQLRHMVRLIDDLLDVSRITQGKLELKREEVTLTSVVEAAIEASRPLIDESGHTLEVALPAETVWLDADATRIAQTISNLLNNSSKYTARGGKIRLAVRREGERVAITVEDNGIGIPESRLDEVFKMFSQVDRSLDPAKGGLGIGLALVRRLAEMHGGTVRAASEGPGRGSTFTLELPVLRHHSDAPAAPAEEDVRALSHREILVVDDNVDAADMLSAMLDLFGHHTRVANDGPEALAAAQACVPEVIILDIGLPGMSGYDVARKLRQDARFATTALIALTGWGSYEDKLKAKNAGFDFHLTKPVNTREVQKVLAEVSERFVASQPVGPRATV